MIKHYFRILLLVVAMTAGVVGCVHQPQSLSVTAGSEEAQEIPLFSNGRAGQLPQGWQPFELMRTKKHTDYELVDEPTDDASDTVLHARAIAASSALHRKIDIDPYTRRWLEWRWKTNALIANADNFHRETDDSPTRIVLAFDGDRSKLTALDQILFDLAALTTGHEIPYATLMYIWENKAPVASVIPNNRTRQIQGIVVESGNAGVGQWRNYRRDIVADYEKAFNEKPGRLIGIGVLTDTDNTGQTIEAWYGDIKLLNQP